MAPPPAQPPRPPVLEDLPFHLARMTLAFRRFNDRTLQAVGLDPQPPGLASVLHALDEADGCTINRLLEQTHLPNGTLTGLLDALEADGKIERVRNPDDGRSWRIRLSRDGRKLCVRLAQRHRLVMKVVRGTFSEDEIELLKRLLARATARMREFPSGAAAARARGAIRQPRVTAPRPKNHSAPKR